MWALAPMETRLGPSDHRPCRPRPRSAGRASAERRPLMGISGWISIGLLVGAIAAASIIFGPGAWLLAIGGALVVVLYRAFAGDRLMAPVIRERDVRSPTR